MEFSDINFSKEKKFNNEFDDLHSDVWLVFDIICTRKVSMEKSKGRQKCDFMEKLFLIKLVYRFKLMTVSNCATVLKLIGPFAFMPVHKFSLHDKLSMYNCQLWTMYNEIQSLGFLLIRILFKISKDVTLQKLFQVFRDNVYKISEEDLVKQIIKTGIMSHLKRIWKFSKWRRKKGLCSTNNITLIFPIQKLS